MLTRASKCPTKIMEEVANFVWKHENFVKENLPLCSNPTDVTKTLAASESWFVLADGQSTAILGLRSLDESQQSRKFA